MKIKRCCIHSYLYSQNVSNASSKTSKSRDSLKDTTPTPQDNTVDDAWDDGGEWGNDKDDWGALEDTAPPSKPAKATSKTTRDATASSSALKLGSNKKKPEPDFGLDDWGSDNSWGVGSTKSNTSRTSKSSASSERTTSKASSKAAAKPGLKSEGDFGGGWDDMADWGDMDGGDTTQDVGDTGGGGGGWGDDWGAMEDEETPTAAAPSKVRIY